MWCTGALLLLIVSHLGVVDAVGCGISFPTASKESCTDWQCSRPLVMGNATYCVRGFPEWSPCATSEDCYRELECNASRCVPTGSEKRPEYGYIGVAVAIVCFGSNYIPVKMIPHTGNGMIFQLLMTSGILFFGVGVQLVRQTTVFYPKAMIGGMMWAIANCITVPIIRTLGMGLAIAVVGTMNMLTGWACGHFGIWGVETEEVKIAWLSYVGVAVAVVAIIFFGLVEPAKQPRKRSPPVDTSSASLLSREGVNAEDSKLWYQQDAARQSSSNPDASTERVAQWKRFVGFFAAVVAGLFFGLSFIPSQAMMDNYSHDSLVSDSTKFSPNGLDYAFSAYVGIFVTSCFLVFVYSAVRRVEAVFQLTEPEERELQVANMVAPAFICGLMWACGASACFIANTNLHLVVTYPLICLGPSVVANIWGVCLFREITGLKNAICLTVAFLLVGCSCVCTVLANQGV